MRADQIVALCGAHGIDFIRVAGAASDLKGPARKRRRSEIEIQAGIGEIRETVKGKESRVWKPAAYTQAELGIAAYGTSALAWNAVQHSIANDRRPATLECLHRGLMYHAGKFATQDSWEVMLPGRISLNAETGKPRPGEVRDWVFYREALCMLVLDEISFKPAFTSAPPLYAIYLGIEPTTWVKTVEPRFRQLQMRYQVWYGAGLRLIQRGINGPEETSSVA